MKVLLVGPKYNGIAKVIKVLKKHLTDLGVNTEWKGTHSLTFDPKEIIQNVNILLQKINFQKYDILDFHIGMYEAEQLLLLSLRDRAIPPTIFSVHSLEFELFKKIGLPKIQNSINEKIGRFFNGYIFFGNYARRIFRERYGTLISKTVFLCPTHADVKINKNDLINFRKKYQLRQKFICLIGYPSKWKDWELLLKAIETIDTPIEFIFAGPWWDQKLGFTRKKINNVLIKVFPQFIEEKDFVLFIKNSLFGIFPYITYPTFQGSGVLSNYIWEGKTCIVSNVACLPEYIGNAGIVINNHNPNEWGKTMSLLIKNETLRKSLEEKMKKRSKLYFSPTYFARQVKKFYIEVLKKQKN